VIGPALGTKSQEILIKSNFVKVEDDSKDYLQTPNMIREIYKKYGLFWVLFFHILYIFFY
jgi:hypothetical protein